MANRRMFSLDIVDTDAFLDMSDGSQNLYFHLGMRADDDGFISNPKKIARMLGANNDDYIMLKAKRFVLELEDGICVIKHWLMHNQIKKDRYTPTKWVKQKQLLFVDKKTKKYKLESSPDTDCIRSGDELVPQYSIDKYSIDKNIINIKEKPKKKTTTKRFVKPTIQEVKDYCLERKNNIDAGQFIDFYDSKGWLVGKNGMKNWKAAIRTWERNDFNSSEKKIDKVAPGKYDNF